MKKTGKIKPFYFHTSYGNYTGQSATSLEEFEKKVQEVDVISLEFHLYGGDFEKWLYGVGDYKKLVKQFRQIRNMDLKGEQLRTQISDVVSTFLKKRDKTG
jgi:hypothetical protein